MINEDVLWKYLKLSCVYTWILFTINIFAEKEDYFVLGYPFLLYLYFVEFRKACAVSNQSLPYLSFWLILTFWATYYFFTEIQQGYYMTWLLCNSSKPKENYIQLSVSRFILVWLKMQKQGLKSSLIHYFSKYLLSDYRCHRLY